MGGWVGLGGGERQQSEERGEGEGEGEGTYNPKSAWMFVDSRRRVLPDIDGRIVVGSPRSCKDCVFSGVPLRQRGEQHPLGHQELPHEDDQGQGGQRHRRDCGAAADQSGPISHIQLCAGEKEMELKGCNFDILTSSPHATIEY